jgi:ATP synthase protein I
MPKRPSDEEALKQLGERLETLEARTQRKPKRYGEDVTSVGYQMVAELIGGLLCGLGLGWLLDQYVGTRPWGMVAGTLLGTGVGVYLVVKTASRMSAKATEEHGTAPSVPFDDEDEDDAAR